LLTVPVKKGKTYLVQRADAPTTHLRYAPVTGTAPTAARHLGRVQLGLDAGVQSGSATVGAVLGGDNRAYGLTPTGASASTAGDVGGLTARTGGDLSFDVADDVAATGSYDARVTVSYYDHGTGSLAVQYDNGARDRYHQAGSIALTGTDTWKSAEVTLSGAWFGGLQAGGADLRLHSADGPVSVHSVGLTVSGAWVPDRHAFPPAPAITTPRTGATVKLASSVSGTAVPNGTVTVREASGPLCTATADDGGDWSCAPEGGFTPGRQTATATVADPGGMVSDASPGVAFDASDLPPGTAVVGAVVGETDHAYGMSEDERPSGGFDGPTTASVIDGLSARTSTQSNIYFDIDDSIAHAGYYSATFTVSYYDQGTGSFSVQYDNGSSDPYKSTRSIQLTGTGTWKTATVSAEDAYFGGKQHSAADFRLRNGGGQVTVHSVAVRISGDGVPDSTLFAPPVTVTSPAPGATVEAAPTVSGTAEPGATVAGTAGGAALCTAQADDSGEWSCAAAEALAAGGHTLTATATDPTGTPAEPATVEVTVG
jgi:hypothetical protein